ncbi:MAG: hypothetical protein NTW26_03650 [bacterium]|nr:hypothetical protein [bacterium]
MPAQLPWYRLFIWFGAGLAAAVTAVIVCSLPGAEPLEGRTYDAVSDSPLGGVEVTVWPVSPPVGFDPADYDAESGPDGRFSIPIPKKLYPVILNLRADGYAPQQTVAAGPGNLAVALVRAEAVPTTTVLTPAPDDAGPTTEKP